MSLIDQLHGGYVFKRRVRVLSSRLAPLLPPKASVLDVGCGDGTIAKLIMELRPDVKIEGIDVLVRPQTHIPVTKFDGKAIPHPSGSFDCVMFVDVLHHTDDPNVLLREAARVSRSELLLKDHNRNGICAGSVLRFMDWVGNARHNVVLPYNYWTRDQWAAAFKSLDLETLENQGHLGLYPFPASLAFERQLHFIAKLRKRGH